MKFVFALVVVSAACWLSNVAASCFPDDLAAENVGFRIQEVVPGRRDGGAKGGCVEAGASVISVVRGKVQEEPRKVGFLCQPQSICQTWKKRILMAYLYHLMQRRPLIP